MQVVCKIDALTPSQAKDFKSKIDDEYRVNMILDNLPVGMVKIREFCQRHPHLFRRRRIFLLRVDDAPM